MLPAQHIESVLWEFHHGKGIRWLEVSHQYGEHFDSEWVTSSAKPWLDDNFEPRYILLPQRVLFNIAETRNVERWLDQHGMFSIPDEGLNLTKDVARVILLDEDYSMGVQVLWVQQPQEPKGAGISLLDLVV